ncbi:hypothetical protein ES708_30113 [subsurface metagenome]
MLWHGTVENIPSGWHICDGTMGTPNLANRFVRGASDGYPPDLFAGSPSHHHNFTSDEHSHTIVPGTGLMAGTDYALETESVPAVGETDSVSHLPHTLRLCFIMKL